MTKIYKFTILFDASATHECYYINVLDKNKMCDYQTEIKCEKTLANITCPDSMSVFIIEGYYGRKDGNE